MRVISKQNMVTFMRSRVAPFDISFLLGKPGNTLWLKADSGVYSDTFVTEATDGVKVTRWTDNSPTASYAYQDTVSRKPTFRTGQQNGLPALAFDRAYQTGLFVQNTNNFNVKCQTQFVVGKYYNVASNGGFIGKGTNSSGPDGQSGGATVVHRKMQMLPYASNLSAYWAGKDSNSGNAGVIPSPYTRLDWNIYCAVPYRNNLVYHNINGFESWNNSAINISYYNTSTLGIGATFSTPWAEWGTVDVGEVIVFNYTLTQEQVWRVMEYLSDKWGIPLVDSYNFPTTTARSFVGSARPTA